MVPRRTHPLWTLLPPSRQEEATTTLLLESWRPTRTGEGRGEAGTTISRGGDRIGPRYNRSREERASRYAYLKQGLGRREHI